IRSREAIDPRTKTSAMVYEIIASTVRLTSQKITDQTSTTLGEDRQTDQFQIDDPNELPF
ncbi:MAG: hypothetical protein RR689_01825, partial [Mucinivorans sp.]